MSPRPFLFGSLILLLLGSYFYVHWQEARQVAQLAPAPAFDLPLIRGQGQRLSKESLKGQWTVMNFWASWCHACQAETPLLSTLEASLKDRGGRVVGIASYDEKERILGADKLKKLSYEMALDQDGAAAMRFDIHALPQTVVMDPQGHIRYRVRGKLTAADIHAIQGML